MALHCGKVVAAEEVKEDDGHLHFTLGLVLGGEGGGGDLLPGKVVSHKLHLYQSIIFISNCNVLSRDIGLHQNN